MRYQIGPRGILTPLRQYRLFTASFLILCVVGFQGYLFAANLNAEVYLNQSKEKLIRLAYQAIQNNQLEQLKKLVQDGVRPDDYYGSNETKVKLGIPLVLITIEKRNLNISLHQEVKQ